MASADVPVEGSVRIQVVWDGARVDAARVTSRRPQPQSLLHGRELVDASVILPRLYSICGDAQGVAAMALEALTTSGELDPPATQPWRERLRLETVREHLWRLGLDWAQAAGFEPFPEPVKSLLSAREGLLEDRDMAAGWARQTRDALFGTARPARIDASVPESLQAWIEHADTPLAGLLRSLAGRLEGVGRARFSPLPSGCAEWLLADAARRLRSDPDYHWRPDVAGQVFEMGPAARSSGGARLNDGRRVSGPTMDAWTRVVARVFELERLLDALENHRPAMGELTGWRDEDAAVVSVEMARGVLMHWVRLEAGRIADYRIVAPTEWNFHPQGACREGLLGMEAGGEQELEERVRLHVMALDPCVRHELEVFRA
ncbi:nickel-dependent hydrogenase large subunit [Thioalkalivibrio sp.]|uniref:nickel-dependent hydrogenase large subunit n=1 Tax=Thioalkalivibrio sp. TaxID=2093813 RepID=UPI0039770AF1